jgi:TolA-binding protein
MRNGHKSARRAIATLLTPALASALLVAGCDAKAKSAATPKASPQQTRVILDAGFQALDAQQYNEAIAKADEVLAASPHGPGSAEALYLKGRGFEGRNAAGVTDQATASENLQQARTAYIAALELNPKQPLQAYVRTSLGNVAYFQDDYSTAVAQLNTAYDKLDNEDVKAWVLYRIGVSEQRLGQFDQADKTFAQVQEKFPGTVPAQRAKEHERARAFYVQLATFATPALAATASADLKRQGVNTTQTNDPQGHVMLRVGPVASYNQAQYLKNRFTAKYPDAIILP